MRNLHWMLVAGVTLVIAIGGAVYYFFPKQPTDQAASMSN
jgi:hypothetical protein